MSAQSTGNLLALGALSSSAALGFTRLFNGGGWVGPVLAAVAAALGVAILTRRWPARRALVVSLAGLVVLVVYTVAGHTTFFGMPTTATAEALGRAVTRGFEALRDASPPTATIPGLVLLSVTATWLCVIAAGWLAFRSSTPLAAIIPPLALHVTLAVLDPHGLDVPTTFLFVVACLLFVAFHHAVTLPTTWFAGRTPPPSRLRLVLGGGAVAVFVAGAGLIVGPALPGAEAKALIEVRRADEPGESGPRITVSPLVDIKKRLTASPPVELFTVASPAAAYWRLTALPTLEPRGWSSYLRYRRAKGDLPDPPGARRVSEVRQEFRVGTFEWFWLPAAYRPARVDFEGARFDPETLTLATPKKTGSGLEYRVESKISLVSPTELKGALSSVPPGMASYVELPPDYPLEVRDLAQKVATGAAGPYQVALALQNHLRKNYAYDLKTPPGHTAQDIRAFLFERKAGYCEQFAASFAVMARSIGLPARVAVGWTPGTFDPDRKVFKVTSEESHAWPEVFIDGFGWLAFEPTPGRSEPTPTDYTGTMISTNPAGVPAQEVDAEIGRLEGAPDVEGGGDNSGAGPVSPGSPKPTPPDESSNPARKGDSRASNGIWMWVLLGALFLLVVGLALASVPPWVKRRRRSRRRAAAGARARVAGAWWEALDRLREAGALAPLAATPLEFARRYDRWAPKHRREVARHLSRLAPLFTKASYCDAEPSDEEASRAWQEVDSLLDALDSSDSIVGRWLRRLDLATVFAGRAQGTPAVS